MPDQLTVMIVGAGAREHALSAAYEASPRVARLVMAPGNDFHTWRRDKEVVRAPEVSLSKPDTVLAAARAHGADLVDVAQDDALAAGTVDLLQAEGIRVFGPSRAAAQIEWDKAWSRGFMERQAIPSPAYRAFTQSQRSAAERYLAELYDEVAGRLVFVKAAGLCAGKGALSARSQAEALARIDELAGFGEAGRAFVIEEGLVGEEFSYYAISDGASYRTVPSAQDNKLSHDGDKGEQTGGIGAVSPASLTTPHDAAIQERMVAPVIAGMSREGRPYRGVLYLGGIVTKQGLQTIEYNARWGDPEVQAILPGWQGDYLAAVEAVIDGTLKETEFGHDGRTRVCVVGAAKGYPGDYAAVRGREIRGLEEAAAVEGVRLFGAAIAVRAGRFYAEGGRLFSIVAEGDTVAVAQTRAYEAMHQISIEGGNLHYRTDIGDKERERRG